MTDTSDIKTSPITFATLRPSTDQPKTHRFTSRIPELDKVLDASWVSGASYVLSGDPGAGKSTLLLQALAEVARAHVHANAVYVTAEEAAAQVQARAVRLGLADLPVRLAETDDLSAVFATLIAAPIKPSLVVVDSAQRMYDPAVIGEPGSVPQVRNVGKIATRFARDTGATVVIVCHETKGGRAAGPNALFHDVDAVLHLSVSEEFRLLRARKNRYGRTDVVGIFTMGAAGLTGYVR